MTTNAKDFDRLLIRTWRMGFLMRFLLFQRHRHNRVVLETIAGKPILVLPEVLNPKLFFTGEFFAETLRADPAGLLQPEGSGWRSRAGHGHRLRRRRGLCGAVGRPGRGR